MVGILIDIHFLDAQIKEMNLPPDTSLYIYKTLEEDIWVNHATSEKQFKESLKYFINNSVEYEEIYKKVIDSIGVMESMEKSL